jgi:alpha-glucosidase (family GH31 glycosyl hydrolase)
MKRALNLGLTVVGILAAVGCAGLRLYFGEKPTVRVELAGERQDVVLVLDSPELAAPLRIAPDAGGAKGSMFYETASGVHWLRGEPAEQKAGHGYFRGAWTTESGGKITVAVDVDGSDYLLKMAQSGGEPVTRWGFNLPAGPDEYFTGLMERVVDGPQSRSWAEGVSVALDLRGERVEMVVRPTLGLYAPFFISSAGYGVFTHGTWPGVYDFGREVGDLTQIAFDGPDLSCRIYTCSTPAPIVQRHAQETGPTILPPKWAYEPIRWRDEHNHRQTYYDGTPVSAPYNSELVEDVLMMEALGIPVGAQWVDRPFGEGPRGYSDFTWDPNRFPNAEAMIDWVHSKDQRFILWIAPWVMGKARDHVFEKGWQIPKQIRAPETQPHLDFSNPETVAWWQEEGIGTFIRQGVDAFKLDRAEEWLSERGEETVHDGRTITEWRNHYPVEYVKATHDVFKRYRPDGDFFLFPRAAYTGSAQYSGFWHGDIQGPPEGLRAAIIAQQRCAIMGYPIVGSDVGGYHREEREPLARWLGFSCFSPLFEVGPTWNGSLWSCRWEPSYDIELLAIWRLYSRLRMRLIDYTDACAREAHATGMPIVRPLFLIHPEQPEAWQDWQTYYYGPDIVVSAIWQEGKTFQQLYLPAGEKWVDAWDGTVYEGGKMVMVDAPLHKLPIFLRQGSKLELGDLNAEYAEALKAVAVKPDLAALQKAQNWK